MNTLLLFIVIVGLILLVIFYKSPPEPPQQQPPYYPPYQPYQHYHYPPPLPEVLPHQCNHPNCPHRPKNDGDLEMIKLIFLFLLCCLAFYLFAT